MGDERGRVVLRLSNDPRLLAVVVRAVEYIAERVGFDARASADLTAAVEQACRETAPPLSEANPRFSVMIEHFADRIEVTLENEGRPGAAAGGEGAAGRGAKTRGGPRDRALHSRVDRVLCDTHDGTSRMILVKYLRAPRPEK